MICVLLSRTNILPFAYELDSLERYACRVTSIFEVFQKTTFRLVFAEFVNDSDDSRNKQAAIIRKPRFSPAQEKG